RAGRGQEHLRGGGLPADPRGPLREGAVKAAAVRKAAERYTSAELEAAAEALAGEEREILEIEGDDPGERLTHLLLALRVRSRMDAGEDLKEAFRAVMADVRGTLTNE